jgi:hypothetical protein
MGEQKLPKIVKNRLFAAIINAQAHILKRQALHPRA